MDYSPLFAQAGQQYNVDPALLQAVMMRESAGNSGAVSSKGASGLMQLMPGTAKDMGVTDPADPVQNIMGGAKYLSQQLDKYGSVPLALAAYNAGPAAVDQHGGIPPFPETQNYVKAVTGRYQSLSGQGSPMSQNLPGLPPTAAPQDAAPAVDPFAGLLLPKTSPSAAAASAPPMVDPFAGVLAPKQSAPAAAIAPTAATPWDTAMRQLGLTARAAVSGLTSLPTMAGDALNSGINLGIKGVNAAAGTHINPLQMPSQVVQNTMNAIGVPQPQNATERVVQDAAGAMTGVAPFVGAGGLLAKAASPAVQAIGQGMQSLPGMQTVGAAGAAIGSGVTREDGGSPLAQIGGGLLGGALGAIAPSAALAGVRGVRNLADNAVSAVQPWINPQAYVGKGLASSLGPDAAAVADNIRSAPQFVLGSMPTTAQVANNPLLVATQKAAANSNAPFKIALSARDAENNAARWTALNDVAQSPQALAAAQTARESASSPLYAAAHAQTAPIDNGLLTLAQRPAMKSAMQSADLLAKNEGVQLQWPTPESPTISGQAVDYTNRALGDLISSAKSSGSPQQARALMGARDSLTGWAEQNIPGIKTASQTYATTSVPVNTMEAAQQMAEQLGKANLDAQGNPLITKQAFQTNMARALKAQPYGIDPAAQQTLGNIGSDLQRATISNSLTSPGSDTAYNIGANGWLARQLYGENFQGGTKFAKIAGSLGATLTGHPIVGGSMLLKGGLLGTTAGSRLQGQLSGLLLDPATLLPYLDAASKQAPKSLPPRLGRNIAQGLLGASTADSARP